MTHKTFNHALSEAAPWGPALHNWAAIQASGTKQAEDGGKLFRDAQKKHAAQVKAFCDGLEKEVAALESKVSGQIKAMLPAAFSGAKPEDGNPKMRAAFLHNRRELLQKAIAAGPEPSAKVEHAQPVAPAAALTPAAIGKAVISTVTHPDPVIQKPASEALATISSAAAIAARLGLTPEPQGCTRAEFNALSPRQKSEFARNGGRIADEKSQAAIRPKDAGKCLSMSVRQFQDTLTPAEKMDFVRRGGKLTE
jgi:hypothetical protein